jgi:hypothetical protein
MASYQIQGLKPLAILCGPFGAAGRSGRATKKAQEAIGDHDIIQNQLTPTGSHEIARGFNPWTPEGFTTPERG